jgi:hypothetical protein
LSGAQQPVKYNSKLSDNIPTKVDENRFFKEVVLRIRESLDLEKALWHCFLHVLEIMSHGGRSSNKHRWPESSIIVAGLMFDGLFVGSVIIRSNGKGHYTEEHEKPRALVKPAAVAMLTAGNTVNG